MKKDTKEARAERVHQLAIRLAKEDGVVPDSDGKLPAKYLMTATMKEAFTEHMSTVDSDNEANLDWLPDDCRQTP